eukprot:GHVR01110989.1.p2 GENE.GHVR01110989.1~~GHVR01110989.1.p2  ORF type:complete len:225 (+),score=25.47 GHVR01110989.1:1467-2141(+)
MEGSKVVKWFLVMPDVSDDNVINIQILRNYWNEYWSFIEVLIGGTMNTGVVYFDLRPCLTNLRLRTPSSNPVFCLLDHDSFYAPQVFTGAPYPSTKIDFLYGLWQAVVAAWAVGLRDTTRFAEKDLEEKCKNENDLFEEKYNGIAKSIHRLGLQEAYLSSGIPPDHWRLIAGVYNAGSYIRIDEHGVLALEKDNVGGLRRLIDELRDDTVVRRWVGLPPVVQEQ